MSGPVLAQHIELWPLDRLIPYARNARTHSREQIAKIARSIEAFGFTNPILVDGAQGILAGHGRLDAAKLLKLERVPVIVLDHLTEAERRAYILADNKLALDAGWDDELLASELREIQAMDFDLTIPGFDDAELRKLLGESEDPAADECPPVPERAITVAGDLWLLGRHRLLCGDATCREDVERVMAGARADMVFTDPPYGVNYEGGHFHSGDVNIRRKREKLEADDSAQIYSDFLPVALQFLDGPAYMWFAHSRGYDVFRSLHENECTVSAVLVWHKTNATYAAMNSQYKQRHEPCVYFKPKGSTLRWAGASTESTLWEENRDAQNTLHPTQKPVCLAVRAIGNHDVITVADFFGGSGSTLIACEKTARAARLTEIDPRYCDVIVKRWQTYTGKQATRERDGRLFDDLERETVSCL